MTSGRSPDPDNVGDYLISARSFEEYRAMFDLAEADLRGTVLDCPGGGSSFTARARALGAGAVAADPMYALPAEVLRRLVVDEADRGTAHTAAGAGRYCWDFFPDAAAHHRVRSASASLFGDDRRDRPGRYVAAALPALPFADRAFDLVVSSHFLFTYADRLDLEAHRDALRELLRVCAVTVRVFPLVDQGGHSVTPLLQALRRDLGRDRIHTEIRPVDYEFQRGANQMLVLTRA
jgi:hypothetical protein